ncbi:MAG: RNA polymerase sigma factor [Candidatus Korobacteraceae bacterium]|jgi:RNA polymerase sigma-70 factor (ECF subfamily)
MGVRVPASTRGRGEADERLLVEAAQKNPARFGDLYQLHFELVYAFVARRVGNRDVAEDLTSEVFHKALESLPRFEWRGVPFGAWLLKIAANAIADQMKRSEREVSFEDPPDISARPRMEQAQDLARLFRLVNELPGDQRKVMVMRFAEEKSIREAAEHLGKSEGAVKQLQFRGLENLRVRLEAGIAKPRKEARKTKERHTKGSKIAGGSNG